MSDTLPIATASTPPRGSATGEDTTLTVEEMRALGELEAKATPRPWKFARRWGWIESAGQILLRFFNRIDDEYPNAKADGAFIVALRNAAPALIGEASAASSLRAEVARLTEERGPSFALVNAALSEQEGANATLRRELAEARAEVARLTAEARAWETEAVESRAVLEHHRRERDEARGAADRMRADANWRAEAILRIQRLRLPAYWQQEVTFAIDAARGASRSAGAGTTTQETDHG
jgi:hypothetical protein